MTDKLWSYDHICMAIVFFTLIPAKYNLIGSNKLNSLKVLVFSKFPVESATEKDKLWAFIKTKINVRCCGIKYANNMRAQ